LEPFAVRPIALAPATALTEAEVIRVAAPQGTLATRTRITDTVTSGGRGWFGTVQGGCDYQFGLGPYQLVIGAFGDYDFADIHGRHAFAGLPLVADEKLSSQWAVGGRIGWVALPNLMVFFSGGYTEARFDRQNYTNLFGPPFGIDQGAFTEERTYEGLVPGRWRRVRAELPARPVLEDRISGLRVQPSAKQCAIQDRHRIAHNLLGRFQEMGPDCTQRAGLSVQLEWCRRAGAVLIKANLPCNSKAPGMVRGFFVRAGQRPVLTPKLFLLLRCMRVRATLAALRDSRA